MVAWKNDSGRVAIVGGKRTPMARMGTALASVHVTELARVAMQQTLDEVGWPADRIDEVVMGNVAPPADAMNPARIAAVRAGIPTGVPALTVHRNCASGMEAIAQAELRITSGRARAVLAGGAESMSTIPLVFSSAAATAFGRLARSRGIREKLAALVSFRLRHFMPIIALKQGLTDPLTDMIMGKTGEVLAHEFGITRAEQDAFALRSHKRACASAALLEEQIAPVYIAPVSAAKPGHAAKPLSAAKTFTPVTQDVGPRCDQTLEALAKLPPVFDRADGSITIGNSCQVTDGAAMLLVADAAFAAAEGHQPLAMIRGYATSALDPARMGLGPVYAIAELLDVAGLAIGDIGLFEINEAFAAQVLACLIALDSDAFARTHLNRSHRVGAIDPERLNVNGGGIALGHPVGASGARITLNLVHAMRRHHVEWGIASLCVGGGQGAAILVQSP